MADRELFFVELSCDCETASVFYGPFKNKDAAGEFAEIAPTKYSEVHSMRDPDVLARGLGALLGYEIKPLDGANHG